MSSAELTALFLVAGWLGVLSIAVLLVIRQMALVTVSVDRGGPRRDGPEIGSLLPDDVLPDLDGRVSYLLFLSPTCGPCLKIASELRADQIATAPLLALFPGDDRLADDFAALFPTEVEIIRDPAATTIAQALGVASTPFALQVESRVVTGKAFNMRDVSDLTRLMATYEVSDAAEIARTVREAVGRA